MSTPFKNVIIIGAGGNVGPSILSALLASQNPTFNVSVLSRQTSTSTFPSNVKVHKTDYSKASLVSAFKGQDVIISTIAGEVLQQQKDVIDAAIEAGVKRFIPSEFGGDTSDPKSVETLPLFAFKGDVRKYLASKEDKISWSALGSGPFLDWGLKVGFLGFSIPTKTAQIWDDGNKRFSTTNLPLVGRAVVSILTHPAETLNKFVFVQSIATTQNEILAAFEKVSGQKWTVEKISTEEKKAAATAKLQQGEITFPVIADLILTTVYGKEYPGNFQKDIPGGLSNNLLGLKEESLEDTIKGLL